MDEPVNPFAAPQAVVDDRPERVWAESAPAALLRVRLGLTMVYAALCGAVVWVIAGAVGLVVYFQLNDPQFVAGPSQLPAVLYVAAGLAALLVALLFVAGEVFCLSVPQETQSRPYIFVSLLLQFLTVITACMACYYNLGTPRMAFGWGIGTSFTAALSLLCFLLLMLAVARFIKHRDMTRKIILALTVGVASTLAFCGSLTTLLLVDLERLVIDSTLLGWGTTLSCIGMLVSWVMYANTVTYLRKAITV